jgi:hypothetical protein
MNGFDIQSASEVANRLRAITRRAKTFNHDRERILEEIIFMAENFELLALRIGDEMEREMA